MRAPRPPTVPPMDPPIVAASETLLSPVLEGCAGAAVVEDADDVVEIGVDGDGEAGVGIVEGIGVVVGVLGDATGVGVSVTIITSVTAVVGTDELLEAAIW